MKIVQPTVEIIDHNNLLRNIELGGRVCYKSEGAMGEGSDERLIEKLKSLKHESVFEHGVITVKFLTDRGVTHELVRHRMAAYSQESTRYVSSADTKQFAVVSDKDVVEKYNSGLSMRRVSELSRGMYSEWEVYKILESEGVEKRALGNTGVVFSDYFDKIDTVEKAYLLGLIQADGSVRSTGSPQVTITQHTKFSWYIQRMIRNFIRPSAKRGKDKNCHSISVVSREICDSLAAKGVVPNKSREQTQGNINALWASIPTSLIPSFLRGFLDGDGGIRFFKQSNKGETDSCNISWNGNPLLLEKIQEWLGTTLSYKANVVKHTQTDVIQRLSVTQPEVGEALVRLMLEGFVFPYGHPAKTSRMIERIGGTYRMAEWGDPKFKVVMPFWMLQKPDLDLWIWLEAMDQAEDNYTALRENGASAQEARSVLPNSLKTEIQVTANVREWRHILKLRTSRDAHPQIRQIMVPLAIELAKRWPILFGEYADVTHDAPATMIA